MVEVLHSNIDSSVNFIADVGKGKHEARYVHRPGTDYFIAYLSSHNGCNKSCRFCHLTATGQTMMDPATGPQLWDQFIQVFEHYLAQPERLSKVHINFMARGEPLASPTILDPHTWHMFSNKVVDLCRAAEISPTFLISTIMPEETREIELADIFNHDDEAIYYSLYSFDERFRKRWLPKAIEPDLALAKLADWQQEVQQMIKIHFALIAGQNDSKDQIKELIDRVGSSGVEPEFNIVRFNSPNEKYAESERVEEVRQQIAEAFPIKVVPRVGKDVYASCGMFHAGD